MAIHLGYRPHRAQLEIHRARDRRFRTVCCGRRFGKSQFAAGELIDRGGLQPGLYAWIAPSYYLAEIGESKLRSIAGDFVEFKYKNPRRAYFNGQNGQVEIRFLSADAPDTILGEGYQGTVVDEAARLPEVIWSQFIRPALTDHQGWAVFITTPRGRNWIFDMHTRGQDPSQPDYASFTFPSTSNPFFRQDEWEEAKRNTPEMIFRQEYMAEFLEDSAGVFRGIEDVLYSGPPVILGGTAIGCDLAKYNDFTVLYAMDERSGDVFDEDRFNNIDWPIQRERIALFCEKHRGHLVLDSTGAGDPIYDDLRRDQRISAITPVKFTNTTKADIIQGLQLNIETGRIRIPGKFETLINELKRYEFEFTTHGNIRYNAPSGYHDDCVIALALANTRRKKLSGKVDMPIPFDPPGVRIADDRALGYGGHVRSLRG